MTGRAGWSGVFSFSFLRTERARSPNGTGCCSYCAQAGVSASSPKIPRKSPRLSVCTMGPDSFLESRSGRRGKARNRTPKGPEPRSARVDKENCSGTGRVEEGTLVLEPQHQDGARGRTEGAQCRNVARNGATHPLDRKDSAQRLTTGQMHETA